MPAYVSYVARAAIIILMLGCLARMPYGYYQFIRLTTMIVFLFLAYQAYEKKQLLLAVLCAGVAILFNPLIKIYFTRTIWNRIDVAVAMATFVWMTIDVWNDRKKQHSS